MNEGRKAPAELLCVFRFYNLAILGVFNGVVGSMHAAVDAVLLPYTYLLLYNPFFAVIPRTSGGPTT